MITFLLATLLFGTQQQEPIMFSLHNMQEYDSFSRFCQKRGQSVALFGSLYWTPVFNCSKTDSEKLIADYRKEFGVDLRNPGKYGFAGPDFPQYRIEYSGKDTSAVLADFDSDHLVKEAIENCIACGLWPPYAKVLSFSYSYRPYIRKDNKRVEAIVLEPHFLEGDKPFDYPTLFYEKK